MGRSAPGRYDCQVDGKGSVGDHPEVIALNPTSHARSRLLATALIGVGLVAACNPGGSPTASPFGVAPRPVDLAAIPQPHGAQIDLGTTGPGFDGSGDFFSYASDLSPEATVGAYAAQLLRAGFRDAGNLGSWRVFVGPTLTIWIRVGSGGPPTSLLVRIERTNATDVSSAYYPFASPAAGVGEPATAVGDDRGLSGPRATARPVSRRPDPPHGGTATASGPVPGGSGTGSGTTGTASGGTTTGTGATTTGTASPSPAPGTGTSTGGSHSGSGGHGL